MDPLVNVIIATRNRPKYLREAIGSALASTYKKIEVIVSDDGGPPDNEKIARSFRDPRLRYRRNRRPLGIGFNHLAAFREIRGEYFAVLNDDDRWSENFLETLLSYLSNDGELSIAFSDHYVIDSKGEIDAKRTEENTRRWRRDRLTGGRHKPFGRIGLVDKSVPMALATLVRTASIDWTDFPPEDVAYDLWLVYLACRNGRGAYYHSERLNYYRVHDSNATAIASEYLSTVEVSTYALLLRDTSLSEFHHFFRREYAIAKTQLGMNLILQRRAPEARTHLLQAMRYGDPARASVAFTLSLLGKSLSVRSLQLVQQLRQRTKSKRPPDRLT
jgi:glycosyltransferase involved in cell wall biosynthesis